MKTEAEERFAQVVRASFQEILKPLGFKKRNQTFYKSMGNFGHLINLQKSIYYSKEHINFTINLALFLPEFYQEFMNTTPPEFPTEPTCVVRKRIGHLLTGKDQWWDVTGQTDTELLIEELKQIITETIIPFFNAYPTKVEVIQAVRKRYGVWTEVAPFFVFATNHLLDEAENEYESLLGRNLHPDFINTAKEKAIRLGIVKSLADNT